MKTKWAIIISVAVVAVVLVVIFWKDLFKKGSTGSSSPDNSTNAPATFPLKSGSKGAEVKQVQQYLNKMKAGMIEGGVQVYLDDLIIDGIWGAKTQAMAEKVLLQVPVTKEVYNSIIKI